MTTEINPDPASSPQEANAEQPATFDALAIAEQAKAWEAVWHTLNRVIPDWGHFADRGMDAATKAIEYLADKANAAQPTTQSEKVADQIALLLGDRSKGLQHWSDEGQKLAYYTGWDHALQAAIKLLKSSVAPQPQPASKQGLSELLDDHTLAELGNSVGLGRLCEMLDDDQWKEIEPKLFAFARAALQKLGAGEQGNKSVTPLHDAMNMPSISVDALRINKGNSK